MKTDKDWGKIGPVTVRLSEGRNFSFDSIEEACAVRWRHDYDPALPFVDDVRFTVGAFGDREARVYHHHPHTRILFLDEMGLRIPAWRVEEARPQSEPVIRWPWRMRDYDPANFRSGPVPGSGSRRRYRGGWLRAIHTTPERRENRGAELDEDFKEAGGRIRYRRSMSNLPNSYDDIPRGRSGRSWKEHRRTRWK